MKYFGIRLIPICFWLCLLIPQPVQGANPEVQAASLYQQGKYEEALQIWHTLADQGKASAGLYYNIGLAESRLNHRFEAMLGFEQALRLKPMSKTIESAIQEERKHIDRATVPVEPFFLILWYKGLVTLLRPGLWSLFGLIFILLGVVGFISRSGVLAQPWIAHYRRLRMAFWVGGLCLILGWLSYREIYRDNEVLIRETCDFRQAPAEDSPSKRILSPGEKVTVTDRIGDWYNVRLLNLDEGWIQKQYQVPIRIGTSGLK